MSTVNKQRKCVLNCRTNKPLHAFPKDKMGRKVWLKQLALKQIVSKAYVCDNHFSVQMKPAVNSLNLTPWAIPDINLPESFSDDTESDFGDEEVFTNDDEPTNGYSNVDSEEKRYEEADDILVEDDKSMEDTIESDAPDCDTLNKKLCNSAIKKNKVNKAVSKEDSDTDSDNFKEDLEIKLGEERLSPAFEIEQKISDKGVKKRSYKPRLFSRMCGVPQCYNRRKNGISLHKIPKKVLEDRKSLSLWHKTLRMEKPFPKNFIICSSHFKEGSILNPIDRGQRRHSLLLETAFPSLNLPKLSPKS